MVALASPSPDLIRAVLVYQAAELNPELRQALFVAGVEIRHSAKADALAATEFRSLDPQVFLINLDPDLEDHLDALTDLLSSFDRPVIFNESSASNSLSGWDQSRWARHMAAKIRGEVDSHPPRPANAPTIVSPVRKLVPVHAPMSPASPNQKPAPAAAAPAPAVKTSVAAAPAVSAASAPVRVATATAAPAAPLVRPVVALAPAALPPKAEPARTPEALKPLSPTLELPAIAPRARVSAAPGPAALDVDATLAALFGDSSFPAAALAPLAVPTASQELPFEFEVETFEASPMAMDDFASGIEVVETVSVSTQDADLDDLFDMEAAVDIEASSRENDFAGIDLDFDTRSAPASGELTDLDELFRQAQQPIDPAPAAATVRAQAPVVSALAMPSAPAAAMPRELKAAPTDWSLEPLDGEGLAAAPPPQGRAHYQLGKDVPKVAAPTPVPAPAPAVAAAPASVEADTELAAFDFFFEPDIAAPEAAGLPAPDLGPSAGPASASLDDFNFDLGLNDEYSVGTSEGADAVVADLDGLFADLDSPAQSSAIAGLDRVWILGASIGGPEAVRTFLEHLGAKVSAGFIVAQHMGSEFLELMVSQLAKASPLPVRLAHTGLQLRNGEVMVAPVGKRLTIDTAGKAVLSALANDSPYSPSIDQIMLDLSDRMGNRCSAILFSGMASDAVEGAKYICSKGGRVWVQDPSTCVISSMIDGAQAAGVVSYVGSPEQLAEHLMAQQA